MTELDANKLTIAQYEGVIDRSWLVLCVMSGYSLKAWLNPTMPFAADSTALSSVIFKK